MLTRTVDAFFDVWRACCKACPAIKWKSQLFKIQIESFTVYSNSFKTLSVSIEMSVFVLLFLKVEFSLWLLVPVISFHRRLIFFLFFVRSLSCYLHLYIRQNSTIEHPLKLL